MVYQVENPIVELHNLSVAYNQKPVLWNIDFTLPEGNLIGIIGPNGSGKTTTLKSIMGLVPLSSGYVELFGTKLKNVRNRISYVPQRGSVDWDFPANVFEVVLMGRANPKNIFKRYSKKDKEIAWQSLEKVGMEGFNKRQISQLSGGQQQRVFLARALAQEADLYFLDEPFTGVDIATESTIIQLLKDMKNEGKTVIVVHHDLNTAPEYFNWVVLLNTRLVASGPADKVLTPQLLEDAYGKKLDILEKLQNLLKENQHKMREQ